MHYKTEKDLIVEKLEELISRGAGVRFQEDLESNDNEVNRLILARKILLSKEAVSPNTASSMEMAEPNSSSSEVALKRDFVDEFSKVYDFLLSLRGEKDTSKAVAGLVEVVIFIFTVVAALSTKEAGRKN